MHRLSHERGSRKVTSGSNSLNSNHKRRLSVTCRHIDKLLAEMESALNVSTAKLAFPQYASDLSPAQRRVIEDYIGRIRAQLRNAVMGTVQEQTESLRRRMDAMAHKLHETLRATAKVLEVEDVPGEQEFAGVVREMPAFYPGELNIHLTRPFLFSLLGESISRSIVTERLAGMIGDQLTKSLSAYHALLYDWSERTLGQIQRRFEAYADGYRAQVERLVGDHVSPAEQESTIRRDLEGLEGTRSEPTVAS
jgi:hypothetical protein